MESAHSRRAPRWQTGTVIVVVCPGQGSQTPGFLSPWLEEPSYAAHLAELSDAAGVDLVRHGTESDADTIRDTAVAQPLIVAAGLMTLRALSADGGRDRIGGIAGHSVGELTAAAGAGVLSEQDAMRLVAVRGSAMAEAAALEETGMSAVLGGQAEALDAKLAELGLSPANVNGGGQVVVAGARDALAKLAEEPPRGARVVPLAEAATLDQSSRDMLFTFGVAIVVVLLVLAAQFESFVSALIIMFTVPLGLACAVFAMWFTGTSLNVYSQIGLVLLVGVMAKNGILIVEFANQLRNRGRSVREAVEEAANIRLRPVMMTMISTVLGAVPLIFSFGAGAEARSALGWVIVGGLGLATLATLFLTPVAYLLLARLSKPSAEGEARLLRELQELFHIGKADPARKG